MTARHQERQRPSMISIRNLYKIFGPDPKTALEAVLRGADKRSLLQETKHVLGLDNINIEMEAGKISVVMGLSGSGKSTLIRHINRLIDPTSGQLDVGGVNILRLSDDELRQMRRAKMSMVFQRFALFPHQTVLSNIEMPLSVRRDDPDSSKKQAMKWLDRVGLSGFEHHFPRQLSGGMQQRVGIARALATGSEIMLMDEAFSALDPIIRTDMQTLLLSLQKELHKTIMFITHDLDEALRIADKVIVLKEGRIVQQGDPQSIILNPANEYIETFVRDINRARVLRVKSIMIPLGSDCIKREGTISIDEDSTIEQVIIRAQGNPNAQFVVYNKSRLTGRLDMASILLALAPPDSAKEGGNSDQALGNNIS